MAEQLGFRCFMPSSELCDLSSGMVKAEVDVHRLVDHWEYDSRWEMDHVCIRNGLDSSYMESLDLTPYLRNVCLGLHNLANKFQYSDSSLVTKDFTEPLGWVAYPSFLQHDVQGLTRVICEKFEDKAKVGQLWEVSNKAHNAPMLFMVAKHGLDMWPLPPEKSRGVFLLYVKLHKPQKEELCFARGLLIKVSQKPSEALRKLNKMAGFMTYEHTVAFTRGIFLSHEPTHGVFHSNLQRCKYSFRSNSSFKSYDFAPTDASCISWIMILWNLAIRPKNLCSFLNDGYLQPPLLEVVAGKFAELPQEILMEIFALLETPDLVRAGSVCCFWNSAYTSTCGFRRYKWPQTPCLIYTSESARLGDEKWTWLPPHSNFEDCIYKDGLLYAVTLLGQIITFDISGTVVTTKIIMDRKDSYGVERVYIVQDPLGDLLLVRRPEVWIKEASTMHGHGHSHAIFENINWRIAIYKVCIASRKLVRINSLDEHVLFLGHSESLRLSAEDYPEVKPNHVYFTDDSMSVSLKYKLRRRLVIGMFNLETKIMDEIVYPQPWSNCMAPPLLLMPNPRKLFLALVTKH